MRHDRFDDDTSRPLAVYRGEELDITFIGNPVQTDFGVPGSPVWTDIEDIEIYDLNILGTTVDPNTLPKELHSAILELSDELEFSS